MYPPVAYRTSGISGNSFLHLSQQLLFGSITLPQYGQRTVKKNPFIVPKTFLIKCVISQQKFFKTAVPFCTAVIVHHIFNG